MLARRVTGGSGVRGALIFVCLLLTITAGAGFTAQQKPTKTDRDDAHQILHDAYDAVKKNYYDPKYHGLDLDARLREYDGRIEKAASFGDALSVVAAFLEGLNDSHTHYNPLPSSARVDSGFRMQMIGDACFVTRVRPDTDAESKVHPGDQVVGYDGYEVSRADFDRIRYYFGVLAEQTNSKLSLRDLAGTEREVVVNADVQEVKQSAVDLSEFGSAAPDDPVREGEYQDHIIRRRLVEDGDVAIWKMPEFRMKDGEIDGSFQTIRKHKSLILDLRGNPGGTLPSLERLVGNVFDRGVKIADRVGRKESKPVVAKTRGGDAFTGTLIVLVDSDSTSSAELFARVIQIEHRGTVIGDRTAGSVMEAKHYPYSRGLDTNGFYDFSVTDADMVMSDGKSLETTGVVPDETILPTAQDLATGRDPVLAAAAERAGLKLSPGDAGKLFPMEWTRL